MRYQFICMSSEYGRDGTADYTKRLAEQLELLGHQTKISVFGRHDWIKKKQAISASIQNLITEATEFQPDVVSWQYDGHLFSPRAIFPSGIVPDLRPYCKKVQVMIHEIWEGVCQDDPLPKKIKGFLQKRSLLSFLGKTQPDLIHCSNHFYQKLMANAGIQSRLLPLFSNISSELSSAALHERNIEEKDEIRFVLFGGIHHPWNHEPLITKLLASGKKLSFTHVGRLADSSLWDAFETSYGNSASFTKMGEQSAEVISSLIDQSDFAISTYNLAHIEKSGIFATFIDHGIPVIVNRTDRTGDPTALLGKYGESLILLKNLPGGLHTAKRTQKRVSLPLITAKFVEDTHEIFNN